MVGRVFETQCGRVFETQCIIIYNIRYTADKADSYVNFKFKVSNTF